MTRRVTRYYVIVDVDGDPGAAFDAIDRALARGKIQRAIVAPEARVLGAIVRTDPTDIPADPADWHQGGAMPDGMVTSAPVEIHRGCGGRVRLAHEHWRCTRCGRPCTIADATLMFPRFRVADGDRLYTLGEMVAANPEDAELAEWMRDAGNGDTWGLDVTAVFVPH